MIDMYEQSEEPSKMPSTIFKKSKPDPTITKLPSLSLDKDHLITDFKRYYAYRLGRDENCRSPYYAYEALSLVISDRLIERWKNTYNAYRDTDCKIGRAHV